MRRRYRRRKYISPKVRKKWFRYTRLFCALLALAFLLIGIDCRLRPIVQTLAKSQAVILSNKLIDEAVLSCIEENHVDYNYLMKTSTNESDVVTSLQADALHINLLKAEISTAVSERIREIKHQPIQIPLGTLIGGEVLAGRGPRLTFYITLSGNVKTQVLSSFSDAGINQTQHTISVHIETQIYIICPGYNTSTNTETNLVVAETVIVGTVPDTYNYINTHPDKYVSNYPTMGD